MKAQSRNRGEIDYDALINLRPQAIAANPGGRFQLFRVGDAVASRNIHAALYDSLSQLETLGVCRRGYFIEGLGGAQFALPGAVERLRAQRDDDKERPSVLAATDPAQPYGGVLKWPQREGRSPSRTAGAYVVLAQGEHPMKVPEQR